MADKQTELAGLPQILHMQYMERLRILQEMLNKKEMTAIRVKRHEQKDVFFTNEIEYLIQQKDSNLHSLIDTTLEKNEALHEARADELELQKNIDRIGLVAPKVRDTFKLAQ